MTLIFQCTTFNYDLFLLLTELMKWSGEENVCESEWKDLTIREGRTYIKLKLNVKGLHSIIVFEMPRPVTFKGKYQSNSITPIVYLRYFISISLVLLFLSPLFRISLFHLFPLSLTLSLSLSASPFSFTSLITNT